MGGEIIIFVLRFRRGRRNCWEKLLCPESQAMGYFCCQQEALLQPLAEKLAAKGLNPELQQKTILNWVWLGLDVPEKPNKLGGAGGLGPRRCSVQPCSLLLSFFQTHIYQRLLPFIFFGCRWQWMPPAPPWPRPSPGFSLFHWEIGERGGKDSWWRGFLLQLQASSCARSDRPGSGTPRFLSLIQPKFTSFLENILTATLKCWFWVHFP